MTNPFLIPNKYYDILKNVALIFLPALGTAILAAGQIWGISSASKIVASIVVLETFLGTILGISTKAYRKSDEQFDGILHASIEEATGVKKYLFELNDTPESFDSKDTLTFKVNIQPPQN